MAVQVSKRQSKTTSMIKTLSAGLIPALALLSAGCDSGSSSQAPVAAAPGVKAKPAKSVDPLAAMARAVAVSTSDAEIGLTYDIQARPVPGAAVDIKLLFMPTADAEVLAADIGVAQPLSVAGQLKPSFNNVKVGVINEHHFTVKAPLDAHAGIYLANIAVSLTRAGMTSTKSFAIPLVVAQPQVSDSPPPKPAG